MPVTAVMVVKSPVSPVIVVPEMVPVIEMFGKLPLTRPLTLVLASEPPYVYVILSTFKVP